MGNKTFIQSLNTSDAIKYAKSLGFTVKQKKIDHQELDIFHEKHLTHQVIINDIVCEWDTNTGGKACWKVNGVRVGYKSDAINTAIKILTV